MGYTKHNFKIGDVLTAQALNEMDAQIVKNSGEPAWNFDNGFTEELNRIVSSVRSIQNNSKSRTLEFITFSDIHMGTGSYKTDLDNMIQAINYLTHNLNIKFVANLGDTVSSPHQEPDYGESLYSSLVNSLADTKSPYINLMGNHDWIPHIMKKHYATNIKEAMFDSIGSWFYFDDNFNNIRFIMLDDSDRGGDAKSWTNNPPSSNLADRSWQQLTWLANTALKTTKSIVFLSHQGLASRTNSVVVPSTRTNNYYIAYDIACAFKDGSSGTATYTSSSVESDAPTSISWNFEDQGAGTILCHFFGHTHGDAIIKANANANESNTSTAESKLNEIAIDNALSNNDTAHYGTNNTKSTGTVNGVAFDVVSLDLLNNKVKCYRFGTGEDRECALT